MRLNELTASLVQPGQDYDVVVIRGWLVCYKISDKESGSCFCLECSGHGVVGIAQRHIEIFQTLVAEVEVGSRLKCGCSKAPSIDEIPARL